MPDIGFFYKIMWLSFSDPRHNNLEGIHNARYSCIFYKIMWLFFSDPCYDKQEGDYNLDGVFVDYFPEVNPQCNFVKCANQIAYSNPCSIGTKNDDYGAGFCSILDPHFLCGHPSSKKKNKKRDKKPSH